MATQNEHGKLIAAAAKNALSPLGCFRKGQSRVWYSDERFWAISIEFQPSGWSKGSYLNISAKWFWHAGGGLSFFHRPTNFIQFENIEQFKPLIENMAACAAQEVLTMRKRFAYLKDIQDELTPLLGRGSWKYYDAAIIAGLLGESGKAKLLFETFIAWSNSPEWSKPITSQATNLAAIVDDTSKFKGAVLDIIQKSRVLMKLPPDTECLSEALRDKAGK